MKLLNQGEKLCFDISGRKSMFFKKNLLSRFQVVFLKLLVSKKILFDFVFLTRLVKRNREIVLR